MRTEAKEATAIFEASCTPKTRSAKGKSAVEGIERRKSSVSSNPRYAAVERESRNPSGTPTPIAIESALAKRQNVASKSAVRAPSRSSRNSVTSVSAGPAKKRGATNPPRVTPSQTRRKISGPRNGQKRLMSE